jgi:hypothetical protein
MLRILNPPQTDTSTDKEKQTSKDTISRNRNLCDILAKRFSAGPAKYLLDGLDDKEDLYRRQRRLRDIFMNASELATNLWTQKSYLQCEGLQELKGRSFQNGSLRMKASNLHRLDDEEDPRLNGKSISIVVHPAVLAIGTHDGENYDPDRPRVLAKAVVWVEN